MFLSESFRAGGEPQGPEPIQFSGGYPSRQDPAAEGKGILRKDLSEVELLVLRRRYSNGQRLVR